MSDLGYQNKAQAGLKLCYNDLTMFLQRLYDAVTTPWPAYEKIGTHQAGQWLQLNANVLQIENEFYSSIRPKRTTGPCERPITALAERGIQYIEVRCLDIDPTEPLGISEQTARFVDAFLLFCALQDSPPFADSGWCPESAANFSSVVKQGRAPALQLRREDKDVALASWAQELLDQIGLCAQTLGDALNDGLYTQAVEAQYEKVVDTACTPSARMLDGLKESGASHQDYALALSRHHAQTLRQTGLSEAEQGLAVQQARQSLADQVALETNDTEGFDEYVARFHRALKAPC
jgi:glutamate--cysteine ligase